MFCDRVTRLDGRLLEVTFFFLELAAAVAALAGLLLPVLLVVLVEEEDPEVSFWLVVALAKKS